MSCNGLTAGVTVMLLCAALLFGFSGGWLCGVMYEQAARLRREVDKLKLESAELRRKP